MPVNTAVNSAIQILPPQMVWKIWPMPSLPISAMSVWLSVVSTVIVYSFGARRPAHPWAASDSAANVLS